MWSYDPDNLENLRGFISHTYRVRFSIYAFAVPLKVAVFDIFPLFPVLTHDEKGTKTFGYKIGLLDCVDCVGADTFSFEIKKVIPFLNFGGGGGQGGGGLAVQHKV